MPLKIFHIFFNKIKHIPYFLIGLLFNFRNISAKSQIIVSYSDAIEALYL